MMKHVVIAAPEDRFVALEFLNRVHNHFGYLELRFINELASM
jgi:hypothetical protein